MMDKYVDREQQYTFDGCPVFTTDEDVENENYTKGVIERTQNCNLHHLGIYSPIDWWAERQGRPVGWIEVKSRSFPEGGGYDEIFLNFRKWASMMLFSIGTDLPVMFVSDVTVGIERTIRWIPVSKIDARKMKVCQIRGSKNGVVKSRNDREPCILVPLRYMEILERSR